MSTSSRHDRMPRSRAWAAFCLVSALGAPGLRAQELHGPIASIRIVPARPDAPGRPVLSEKQIRAFLKPSLGGACDADAAAESLARRYRFLGYVPTIHATCEAEGLRLSIRESSHRIDLITFDPAELARIGVTPDRDFEDTKRLYQVPAGGPRALLRALLETREGDLYNYERYRNDRMALARLGYSIAFIGGAAEGDETYAAGAYLIQSLTPPPADRSYSRETNYIGATGSYAPRAGGTVGALYQKDSVFGRFDQLTVSPNYNTQLGGDITYRSPFLAHREDPRRLYDFEVDLFSNFQHNRDLLGTVTDQRRSGIGGTFGVRPLGLRAPNDLHLQIGLRHERLDLSHPPPGQPEENLTLLQLGATQEWRHTYHHPSLTLRLAPNLDLSLDRGGGDRSFVRPSLDATLHNRIPSGFEIDLHFLGGMIDRAVPAVELWSLGGPTTVRGYREDTLLGQDIAALQSELWIPFVRPEPARVPPTSGGQAGLPMPRFEPRAARYIRMALFIDGGTIGGTASGASESIYGAGIGLRFVVPHQPLVVRIDYGWALSGERGGAFPYLSMAYRF